MIFRSCKLFLFGQHFFCRPLVSTVGFILAEKRGQVKDSKKNAHYKLTSTVMLVIETETESTGGVSLAGSLTRQVTLFNYPFSLPPLSHHIMLVIEKRSGD